MTKTAYPFGDYTTLIGDVEEGMAMYITLGDRFADTRRTIKLVGGRIRELGNSQGVSTIVLNSASGLRDEEHSLIMTFMMEVIGLELDHTYHGFGFKGWMKSMQFHDPAFYELDAAGSLDPEAYDAATGESGNYGASVCDDYYDSCTGDHLMGLPYVPKKEIDSLLPVEIRVTPIQRWGFRNIETGEVTNVGFDRYDDDDAPAGSEVVYSTAGADWKTVN